MDRESKDLLVISPLGDIPGSSKNKLVIVLTFSEYMLRRILQANEIKSNKQIKKERK